ncbi:MAG: hypothetical protein Satyrvirus1_68 [Satyrvirus sp.]|uniref:Uncharacterized protein n=1 Tax=Satyrvirus sp. TaxID=2487771 RepID=A0A3G5ACU8_9VIRU|nr:MAG: hypothetical protein Satyrvirus1_68 [Satyrvirus sp.]
MTALPRLNNLGIRVFNDKATGGTRANIIGRGGRGFVYTNPNPIMPTNLPPPNFYGFSFQTVPFSDLGDPRYTGRSDSKQSINNGSFNKNYEALVSDRAFFNNISVSRRILENNFKFTQNYQLADYYYNPRFRYIYTRNPEPYGRLPRPLYPTGSPFSSACPNIFVPAPGALTPKPNIIIPNEETPDLYRPNADYYNSATRTNVINI